MTSVDEVRASRRAFVSMACAVPLVAACGAPADPETTPSLESSGSATPTRSASANVKRKKKGKKDAAASERATPDPTPSSDGATPSSGGDGTNTPGGGTGAGSGGDSGTSTGGGAEESASPTATTKPSGALVKTSDVPAGGGVILSGNGIVVTQPKSGSFTGFSNICTHQGCGVSRISGGHIICPCHGSEFSIVDGSVTSGPARTALGSKGVTVKSGWVCKA